MVHILFIDDDPITLNMLSKAAMVAGFRVTTEVDPRDAVQAAMDSQPDAIILDINMPDMDGVKVLNALRGEKTIAEIPVLVLSAGVNEHTRQQVLEAGAREYLIKPLSIKKLLAIVITHTVESPADPS